MKKQTLKKNAMRVLALVVSMVFMLSSMTVVLANDTVTGSFTPKSGTVFTWTLDTTTGALHISGSGAMDLSGLIDSGTGGMNQNTLWNGHQDSIKTVTFDSKITTIGRGLFYYNTSLEKVTIPAGVTMIDWGAFRGCTSLGTVTFAEGSALTTIDGRAFMGCKALTSLTLPSTLTTINNNDFVAVDNGTNGTTNITFTVYSEATKTLILNSYPNATVTVTEDPNAKKSGSFTDKNGTTFTWTLDTTTGALHIDGTGAMTYDTSAPPSQDTLWGAYKNRIKTVTFGSGITRIGEGLFYGNTSLEEVTVPASVDTIAWSAFRDCTALKKVTIEGNTLYSIESRAFQGIYNKNILKC